MDFSAFLDEIRASARYREQIVYVREQEPRAARYAEDMSLLSSQVGGAAHALGVERLYSHQAEAIERIRRGENVLISTGTASGKSLCYLLPTLEMLGSDPTGTALFLFPTKALCQDQFAKFSAALASVESAGALVGVYDGDTPASMRRKLRDHAQVIFSNPDMLHSALMPEHARWAGFLANLRMVVLDELHVYNGMFGSNMANLIRRFHRVCRKYGSRPKFVACSATIANPDALIAGLTGRSAAVVDNDGSPRGRRTYVFWNPPRVLSRDWRSRRSANVEAHELMAMLVQHGVPTITFSKAKMTAEMIYRYVCDRLRESTPWVADKVTAYRGGYLADERREIERRLFAGELIGVSTTPALELGIDVGGLDASIMVGYLYPGTLASFYQQSGRAGRQDRDSLVILVGLDTAVNQYIMSRPDYIFDRPIEEAVIDPNNPFILTGHLRCAAQELPISDTDASVFGPFADTCLRILEENHKVKRIGDLWYHSTSEIPQHEVSLRDTADANVVIEDVDTRQVIGEVNRFDAPPILHPEAIYMHHGDTYRVLQLDLDRNVARVKREDTDYYTQPVGGTDVHHIDHCLREKPFGPGTAYWGEVTAYFSTNAYEKIHFYSLDAISRHGLELPTFVLETMALWIVPPESLMDQVRLAGLDAHSGLRGIGYGTRMMLPLFVTCVTPDFSHSVGSANSPWHSVFIYERYPHGLGFTEAAFARLHEIMPAVLDNMKNCPCEDGCPRCVGKPLRQFTTWNVERGEASIPLKAPAIMILEGLLSDSTALQPGDTGSPLSPDADDVMRVEMSLRRRLERMREPRVFHPIEPIVPTEYPDIERTAELDAADVTRRSERRREFDKKLRKLTTDHPPSLSRGPGDDPGNPPSFRRGSGRGESDEALPPQSPVHRAPKQTRAPSRVVKPADFPGRPATRVEPPPPLRPATPSEVSLGDSLASKARRLARERKKTPDE